MEEMKQRVSVQEAAALLGISEKNLRKRMEKGIWDLGEVVQESPYRKQYFIFRPKLNKLIGLEE